MENSSKGVLWFGVLDALFWAFIACFAGFMSTYMLDNGMSNSFLSIMIAGYMGCSFIGAFFWGSQCDKYQTNRNVFLFAFVSCVIVAIACFYVAKVQLMFAAVLYALFGFLAIPLGSNLDAWMLKNFHKDAGMYGRARAIGSLGYAVAALIMGQCINRFGFISMLVGILATAVPVFVFALLTKEEKTTQKAEKKKQASAAGLFKIPTYIYMLVILLIAGLACAPVNNLKIVYIQEVGGDVGILGLDSFIGVTVQALFISLSGKMKKLPPYFRLTLMSVFMLLDLFLIVTASNVFMIIAGSVLWNTSYGLMLPTAREITEMNVHGDLKNTAHSLADATYGSFAGIVALSYSGFLMDSFGAKFVALIGAILMVVATIMSGIKMMKEKRA